MQLSNKSLAKEHTDTDTAVVLVSSATAELKKETWMGYLHLVKTWIFQIFFQA